MTSERGNQGIGGPGIRRFPGHREGTSSFCPCKGLREVSLDCVLGYFTERGVLVEDFPDSMLLVGPVQLLYPNGLPYPSVAGGKSPAELKTGALLVAYSCLLCAAGRPTRLWCSRSRLCGLPSSRGRAGLV